MFRDFFNLLLLLLFTTLISFSKGQCPSVGDSCSGNSNCCIESTKNYVYMCAEGIVQYLVQCQCSSMSFDRCSHCDFMYICMEFGGPPPAWECCSGQAGAGYCTGDPDYCNIGQCEYDITKTCPYGCEGQGICKEKCAVNSYYANTDNDCCTNGDDQYSIVMVGGGLVYSIQSRTPCPYGCLSGVCYDKIDIGATCSGSFCDEENRLNCDSGIVNETVLCKNGCDNITGECIVDCFSDACLSDQTYCCTGYRGENLVVCDNYEVKNASTCLYGCDSNENECYNQFEIDSKCSYDECDGSILVNCTDSTVVDRNNCQFGCKNSIIPSKCYNQYEIGSICDNSTCDGNIILVRCSNSEVTSRESCEFGCKNSTLPNICYDEYENDSICTMDECDGDTLAKCVNNITDRFLCPFGCNNQTKQNQLCYNKDEIGSICDYSKCDGNIILVRCSKSAVTSIDSCEFGCKNSTIPNICYDEYENDSICTMDECDGDTLAICVNNITDRFLCPFGCNNQTKQNQLCYNRYEIGSNCENDECDANMIVTCSDSVVSSRDLCQLGCRDQVPNSVCYERFEIGSICSFDECDGDILSDCENDFVIDRINCQHGCNSSGGQSVNHVCFTELELGAICSKDVCFSGTVVKCSVDSRIESIDVCELGCLSNMDEANCVVQVQDNTNVGSFFGGVSLTLLSILLILTVIVVVIIIYFTKKGKGINPEDPEELQVVKNIEPKPKQEEIQKKEEKKETTATPIKDVIQEDGGENEESIETVVV